MNIELTDSQIKRLQAITGVWEHEIENAPGRSWTPQDVARVLLEIAMDNEFKRLEIEK